MQDLNKNPTLPCDAANPNPNPNPNPNLNYKTKPTLPCNDTRCSPICCWLQPTHLRPCNRTCQGCNPRYDDASFDVITNSLSVDYMTSPLELFGEIHRVPAGLFHGAPPPGGRRGTSSAHCPRCRPTRLP